MRCGLVEASVLLEVPKVHAEPRVSFFLPLNLGVQCKQLSNKILEDALFTVSELSSVFAQFDVEYLSGR